MGSRYGRDPFRASTGGFQEDSDDRIRSGTRYASPPRQRQARRQPFEFDELGEARLGPERSGPLVRMPIRDRLAPPEPRYGAPERVERRRYHEEDDEREVIRESGRPRDGRRLEELRETRERYHEEDDEYSASTRPRPRNHSFGAIERRPRYDEYERERERDTRDFRERDVYERDVYERDVRQREEYRAPAPAPRAPPPETRFNERYYEDVEVDYAPRRRPEAYEYERIRETEVERRRSPSAVSSASSESHAPSATRKHTKKGSTRIPKKLGSRRAVVELGYPYSEEVDTIVIGKALSREQIDEVVVLSETIRQGSDRKAYHYDLDDRPTQQALEPPPAPIYQDDPVAPIPIIIQIPAPVAAPMAPPAPSVARSSKSRASRGRSSHHSDHEEETISIHEKITEEVREGSVSSSSFSDSMEKVKKRRRAKRPDKAFVLEREESRSVRGPLNLLSAPSRSRSRARSRRDLEEEVRILERERDSKSSTRAKSRSKSRRRKSTSLKIRPEIDLNIVKNRKGEIELVRN